MDYRYYTQFEIGETVRLKHDSDAGKEGDYVTIVGGPQGGDAYNPLFPVTDRIGGEVRLVRYDNLERIADSDKLSDGTVVRPAEAPIAQLSEVFAGIGEALALKPDTGKSYEGKAFARKLYISGPMTGIPNFNYDAFDEAEGVLENLGYGAVNPARMDQEMGITGDSYQDLLARDLSAILTDPEVEGVCLIDGWRNSRGSTLEAYIAQQAGKKLYELKVVEHPDLGPVDYSLEEVDTVSVAYAAQSIVLGARRFTYGHPLDNFLKITELFNATIGHKLAEPLDIRDTAMLMLQVKVAREYNAHKQDNLIDIIGYTLALDEALNEMVRRGGDVDNFLSDNATLLKQHSVMGADSER